MKSFEKPEMKLVQFELEPFLQNSSEAPMDPPPDPNCPAHCAAHDCPNDSSEFG